MNTTEEYQAALEPQLAFTETLVANGLGPVERIVAWNTAQFRDFSRQITAYSPEHIDACARASARRWLTDSDVGKAAPDGAETEKN